MDLQSLFQTQFICKYRPGSNSVKIDFCGLLYTILKYITYCPINFNQLSTSSSAPIKG